MLGTEEAGQPSPPPTSSGISSISSSAPAALYGGIPDVGKVYIVEGLSLEAGLHSLGEIEEGTLPGALVTAEVSLEKGLRAAPHLGGGPRRQAI